MKESCVAIITARGGSKRIPRKNIKDFCGKPIMAYSIEAALTSGLFDEVMVSTDDEEIAATARRYGAEVPFMRSARNADDFAGTADVLLEVVETYRQQGRSFDWVCCIYPTAPFVTAGRLQEAWHMLQEQGRDSLLPVVRFSYPPQRCFVMEQGRVAYKWPEYINSRSQDLEPFYHDAGQFYFVRRDVLLTQKSCLGENNCAMVLGEQEVQDIDNIEDWEMAEMKYRLMSTTGGAGQQR